MSSFTFMEFSFTFKWQFQSFVNNFSELLENILKRVKENSISKIKKDPYFTVKCIFFKPSIPERGVGQNLSRGSLAASAAP